MPGSFGLDDPVRYLGNALYLFGCLFTAYWSFDLQSTVWSADLGRQFAFISIIRRLFFIAALGLFLGDRQLPRLRHRDHRRSSSRSWRCSMQLLRRSSMRALRAAPVTRQGIVAHWKRFWSSLVFALSELFVLNSPYAVVTVLLGVGPALVMFDSVMKVCRLAMAGTRTLAEIFLPRISRQLLAGDMPKARRGLSLVTALCVAASAVPALAVFFFGQAIFDLLLGPNNVVPAQAILAAALIVLISGFYQPATLFLSYLNAARLISPRRPVRFCRCCGFRASGGARAAPGRRHSCGSTRSSSRPSRSSRSSARRGSSHGIWPGRLTVEDMRLPATFSVA